FLLTRRPPSTPLFPYATLFRSVPVEDEPDRRDVRGAFRAGDGRLAGAGALGHERAPFALGHLLHAGSLPPAITPTPAITLPPLITVSAATVSACRSRRRTARPRWRWTRRTIRRSCWC